MYGLEFLLSIQNFFITTLQSEEAHSFVTHASPFLLVPRQLLPVPDLKLVEILFHYFDPLSS